MGWFNSAKKTVPDVAKEVLNGNPKKIPVPIKIWLHSQGGNPPRAHHLDMHGAAVMRDQKFKLANSETGEVFWATGPHDPALPESEIEDCHCRAVPKIIWLTAEEESQLNQEMQVSGGIYEGEWKEFAEEFRQRMLANGESA